VLTSSRKGKPPLPTIRWKKLHERKRTILLKLAQKGVLSIKKTHWEPREGAALLFLPPIVKHQYHQGKKGRTLLLSTEKNTSSTWRKVRPAENTNSNISRKGAEKMEGNLKLPRGKDLLSSPWGESTRKKRTSNSSSRGEKKRGKPNTERQKKDYSRHALKKKMPTLPRTIGSGGLWDLPQKRRTIDEAQLWGSLRIVATLRGKTPAPGRGAGDPEMGELLIEATSFIFTGSDTRSIIK